MIKYRLECEDCKSKFDSWFSSSKEFDKLKKLKLINCNSCNSKKIKKSLMSPKVIKDGNIFNKNNSQEKKLQILRGKLKEYQKFIKNNFEYVGDNFSYEARSIHYDTKKNKAKGIYGKASNEEIKNLNEEGIETQTIPWIKDKEN